MSEEVTFKGVRITDLLFKHAVNDNVRERHHNFLQDFIERGLKPSEFELQVLNAYLSGMNLMLREGKEWNIAELNLD